MKSKRRKSFEKEVLCHLDRLFGYAMHLCKNSEDASDLVQDTYLSALKSEKQYSLGTNAGAWLFTIMRNTFLNTMRKMSRKPTGMAGEWIEQMTREDIPELKKHGPDPGVKCLDNLLKEDITRAFDSLPEEFKDTVVLCDVQGFSYADIAAILDIPIGTVRSRIHRGRFILRHLLADWENVAMGGS
ncbi:MAG: sigma-70 family RNA polymerase sigma factor [Candidatus Aegiribacteria sp.]|nr:sigma-70 family RNA polymerase sigma factor [Candidatus Aegiribacteria sp.]